MSRPQWDFDNLQTFEGYSAEGHVGNNPLFEIMKQGESFYRQGEYQSALQEYQQLIQAQPENGWLHYRVAHAFQELGQLDKALHHYWIAFKRGLSLGMSGEDDALALCDIGSIYVEKNDFEGAIAAFRLSMQIRPSLTGDYGLGQALYLNGEVQAALPLLKAVANYEKYKKGAAKLIAMIQDCDTVTEL